VQRVEDVTAKNVETIHVCKCISTKMINDWQPAYSCSKLEDHLSDQDIVFE